ncbi:MAG: hypothetical protein J5617_03955 [Bacilli bacterium]|nr:hypothetical protein [Bacilli bacterium]
MSKQIENNVVQMTFDNKDFEKNINTSIKSIEKLNEDLKFKDASKGFKDIEKYANEVNFDGLNKAINNINSVFTVTGKLAKNIVDDIAGYFERKITSAISGITRSINYVFDPGFGVQKYEQYTTALLSMTSNLADYDKLHFKDNFGSELEFVEHYIETLALYADETSYSMTDMVDTMAKFAANNVPIEKSSSAMMGLANMAAVAGQNAKTATASMYQLAQAFGTGYVRYQDWAQAFTLKNIATKESKQIFLEAAKEMHTIDEDDIKTAKKVLGEENWMNYFFTSDSLNQGWLKTDTVLVKGLQEYSKASDLILANLEDIGDASVSEILTWADEMKKSGKSATEFVNSISGASMVKVDDVNLLIDTLDKLGSKEYELSLKAFMAAQNATNFHEALEATRDAVGTKMMYALKYFIGDLDQARKLWTKFANSLWDVFAAPLDNALAGLKIWNKGVEEVNEGFLKTIEFEDDYEKFWSSVGQIFTNVGAAFNGLIDQFRFLAGCFEDTEEGVVGTSIIAEYTLDFMKRITRMVGELADATEKFLESDLYLNIQKIFMNIIKTVRNVKRIVGSLFDATIGTVLRNIGGPLTAISEIMLEISDRFDMWTRMILKSEGFQNLIETLTKITTKFVELGTYLIRKFGVILVKIIDGIALLAVKIANFLSPAIKTLFKFIEESVVPFIDKVVDGQYGLGAAIDWVGDKLDGIIPKIEKFTKNIFGMDFKDVKTKFTTFADGFIEDAKRIGSEGFDKIKEYFKNSFDKDTKGSWGALFEAVKEADSVTEGTQNVIRWSADAIMRPIQLIIDLASLVLGEDLTKLSDALSKFIHSIANGLADISPNLFNFINKVGTMLLGILKFVGNLVIDIVKYTAGMTTTTGFGLLDDIIYSIKIIILSLVDAFTYILKQLAEIAPLITPAIKSTFEWLGDTLVNISNTIKEKFGKLAEIKSPDELIRYAKSLLKIVLGIWLIIKVFSIVDSLAFTFKKFKFGRRSIKKQLFVVTDAIGGLFDSLAGWDLPGLLRMFAIVIASIGYAMGNIAKVGEMFSNEKTRKGVIVAFVGVILMFALMEYMVKALMKAQLKMQKEVINYLTINWTVRNVGLDGMTSVFKDMATMLIGLGVALIGISAAIGILAKVSQTTSSSDLYSAVSGVAFILLALGLFLKLAAANQKSNRSLGDGGYNSSKEGKFYKGVAAALIGFAVSMLLMVPAIALLTHTVKSAGVENFKEAVQGIITILGIMGLVMVLIVSSSQNRGFISSMAFIGILGAISKLMVVMAFLMAGLALTAAYLIQKEDRDMVLKVLEYFVWTFAIVGALIAALSLGSTKLTWKHQLADLAVKVGKMIFISFTLTALAMILGAIGGSIWLLVHVMEKYKFNGKVPDVLVTAIYVLIGILAALTAMVWILTKALNVDTGNWKAILARVSGMFLILLAMSNMVLIISGIASLMAYILSFKRVGDNIWKAVKVIVAILGSLTLFLYLMVGIGKLAQGLSGKVGGDDASVELIKIAAAIAVVAASIGVMAGVFVALAKAVKKLDSSHISDAFQVMAGLMLAIAVFALALGVINVVFGGVITQLAGMFKVLMYVILGIVAAVILFSKYGDKIAEWLNNSRPKVEAAFRALGKSIVTAIEGFNEALPLILDAISQTLLIILAWIAYNISDWTFYLILIIAQVLNGIGEALEDEGSEIGQALGKILNGLLTIIMTFLDEVLGSNIYGWFGGLIGGLGDILMYSMPIIGQMMASAEASRQEDEKIKEIEHQKEMYEIRRKGALVYMEMLENLQNAENEVIQASEILDEVEKSQAQRRANENREGWRNQIKALESRADEIYGKYGIDVTKSADAQQKWWLDEDSAISQYNELLKSRDWTKGFDWNERIGAEHDSTWYNNLNPHSSYVVQTPSSTTTSESKTEEKSTTNAMDVITNKLQQGGSSFGETVKNVITGSKGEGSTGSIIGGDAATSLLSTIKEKGSSVIGGIKSGFSDFLGIGEEGGISSFFGGSNLLSSSSYNLDTSIPVTSMDSYGAQVPDIDSLYQNTDMSGGVIDSNYNTAYATDQIDGISNTMSSNSDDVVNAINDQKQAYIDALSECTQAILERAYEIKLDNDVVAGELAPSLDKALGRLQAQRTRTSKA